MAERALPLRGSEAAALVIALAAHVGLVAALMLRPAPRALPMPQRMEVTLADEVGMQATSPRPHAQAAEDIAPVLGESAPKPQSQPEPKPEPKVVPKPVPIPLPKPQPKPEPRQAVKPAPPKPAPPKPAPPKPAPPKPAPKTPARPLSAIEMAMAGHSAKPTKAPPQHLAKTAPKAEADPDTSDKPAGGSRLGADFLKGVSAHQSSGKAKVASGPVAGPAVKAALAGAISRQLKQHWRVPQGVDTDQLVTFLTFDLNRDGSLAGPVRVIRQEGITDSNRPQADIHKENAIRAVQLAAPFQLPPEFYDAWKHLANVRFDRNLSQ